MFYISGFDLYYEISLQLCINCNPVLQLSVMSVSVISLHISVMATSSCREDAEEGGGGCWRLGRWEGRQRGCERESVCVLR